jgi:hypothetical protein
VKQREMQREENRIVYWNVWRSTELRTVLQCKMVELYMLKQDKNRKYNCPVQMAVYGHTVEGTIYLTILRGSFLHIFILVFLGLSMGSKLGLILSCHMEWFYHVIWRLWCVMKFIFVHYIEKTLISNLLNHFLLQFEISYK